MKSITIRSKSGRVLLKILHRKSGQYDLIKDSALADIEVEVRDDEGHKVKFESWGGMEMMKPPGGESR